MNLQEALKYSTNRTHSDFVDAALAQPESEVHPLVYADWLQEQGQEGLAEQVRKAVSDNPAAKKSWEVSKSVVAGVLKNRGVSDYDLNKPAVITDPNFANHSWAVGLTTIHPNSTNKAAFYDTEHTPEHALELLKGMGGVAGQTEALKDLQKRFPHLFAESE